MKQLRTLAIMLGFLLPNLLMSQSFDYVTGFGFNTMPNALVELTGGRWLALCTGKTVPGAVHMDTVVAVVFDSEGNIKAEKRLDLPNSGVYYLKSAIGTPDGGFAVAISLEECDYSSDEISLQAFDANGILKWSKHDYHLPSELKISPDGYLTGINEIGNKIVAYNVTNGDVKWTADLADPGSFHFMNDFEFVTGGNTILAVGGPDLQLWEKLNSTTYYLTNSRYISGINSADKIVNDSIPGGLCYTFEKGRNKLFIFDPYTLDFSVLGDYPFKIIDLIATTSNLVALAEQDGITFLLNITFQGGIMNTIRTYQTLLKGEFLAYQNNTLSIAGINGSGPLPNNSPWLPFNAHQLWLHTNHLNGDPALNQNVALTQVIQNTNITADSLYTSWTQAYSYNFSGGDFGIEIKNLGGTLLESIDVNIGFEWVTRPICYYRPVNKKHYSGLGLPPQESMWLEFGDVQAEFQPGFPTQLCFWTSAPNHKPDAAPENDIFCKSIYTVQTNEPGKTRFSVSPNPANDFLKITFQEIPGEVSWKMYDLMGRQIKTGIFIPEDAELNINTAEMVPGFYILLVNGISVKVLVEHFN